MRKIVIVLSLGAALLLVTAASAAVERSSSKPELMFVGFKATPGAAERALIARHGGTVVADFSEINVLSVEIAQGAIGELARERGVEYIEKDELRFPLGLADAELTPAMSNGLYGLITTRSVDAHARGVTGTGINVGVADTGLDYTHPDIAPNYKGGIDAFSDDADPFWGNDPEETHGTHVAGTVVAALNGSGVRGVAYNANLYHARVCGPGGCPQTDIMQGVRWLVETAQVKVVNLSLGGPTKSRTEERFYNEMRSKGALVVAAAGNDGRSRLSYPAAYPVNVSVAAVDRNNAIASFSNGGRGLDISAPGVGVLSSVPPTQGSEASVTTTGTFTAFALEFAGRTNGVTGTLVDCGIGQAGQCPAAVAGNIALIQRGTLSFADKVTNAMNQGATAAIVYNNAAGDFVGTLGSPTTSDGRAWIPAVSVSDTTGATLVAQVGTSATVVNQASSWDHYDGTSMATPHVTGAAALVWSVNPTLTNTIVESHLFNTAGDLGPAGYDTTFGRGIVNASAAAAAAGG